LDTLHLREEGLEVDGRIYHDSSLHIATISRPFSEFAAPVRWREGRRCFEVAMGGFSLSFPGDVDNQIVQTARAGELFMLGGVFSPKLAFVRKRAEQPDYPLFELDTYPHPDGRGYVRWLRNRRKEWVSLDRPSCLPLVDFFPEVVTPTPMPRVRVGDLRHVISITPQMCRTPQSFAFGWRVKIGLGGDPEWRERLQTGRWSLAMTSLRIVLQGPNGMNLPVALRDGQVLGSDGKPYLNERRNEICFVPSEVTRYKRESAQGLARRATARKKAKVAPSMSSEASGSKPLSVPTFNFFEVALHRDRGVIAAAEEVAFDELSSILLDNARRHEVGFVVKHVSGGEGTIWLNIKDEQVPLCGAWGKANSAQGLVHLVIKKRFGKIFLAVHRPDGAFIDELEYDRRVNRFFTVEAKEGAKLRRKYVDFVPADWNLSRYTARGFLNSRFEVGTIIYVHTDEDGRPVVRTRMQGLLPRHTFFDRDGEPTYVFGKLPIGIGLQPLITAWLPSLRVVFEQSKAYVCLWGRRYRVPSSVVEMLGEAENACVDVYVDGGEVVDFRPGTIGVSTL
jgi:hypothetical protein